jgi:hypothetical protein
MTDIPEKPQSTQEGHVPAWGTQRAMTSSWPCFCRTTTHNRTDYIDIEPGGETMANMRETQCIGMENDERVTELNTQISQGDDSWNQINYSHVIVYVLPQKCEQPYGKQEEVTICRLKVPWWCFVRDALNVL